MLNSRLAIACLVLAALLCISAIGNWSQFTANVKLEEKRKSDVAIAEARGDAELKTCAGTNTNNVATIGALGDELHKCRGEEARLTEALGLALRQRERARQQAEGELRMRREAIEAIRRNDANGCDRPICRALSDELLGNPPGAEDQ